MLTHHSSTTGDVYDGLRLRFYTHPQNETDKGAVKSVREFLIKAGIKI
ncbi:hypothetical protein [uncultured Nostoc sp.]